MILKINDRRNKIKQRSHKKGKKAETILEDELFKEAIGALKVNYVNQIINTSYKDSDGRTAIWIAIHQLDKVPKPPD